MTAPLIAFRVDASIDIGTGHVMRCLTLADELKTQGAECHFISRAHNGHLIEQIRRKGHTVHSLPLAPEHPDSASQATPDLALSHGGWLGATQAEDAAQCAAILATMNPQWLVVDHYAIDMQWESALKPYCGGIMVIDDLADRHHQCQLLLDQTLSRSHADYRCLVPSSCILLCGSEYALLRPEFARLRAYSVQRRQPPQLGRVLVTLGGIDKDNATSISLEALNHCALPPDCHITVVMGANAPWLEQVREQAARMTFRTTVLTNVNDMALIMADSDLAIGAAGATSWERCCLALPSIQITLAENQRFLAESLIKAHAVLAVARESLTAQLSNLVNDNAKCVRTLDELASAAKRVTDGLGTSRVVKFLYKP